MVKKTGEEGSSHLARLCKRTRPRLFLDEETEGSLKASNNPQQRHDGGCSCTRSLPEAANTNLQTVAEETLVVWKLLGKPAVAPKVSAADWSNSEGQHTSGGLIIDSP